MTYRASDTRYDDSMQYRRTGRFGLKLPAISLGLWQNFGGTRDYPGAFEILSYAFDHGITHFDLANNYGPPPGSAEELFGDVMARDFRPYRDELIISSKAGWDMWPGPYGNLGSRKYLIASCDQSLKRMGLDVTALESDPDFAAHARELGVDPIVGPLAEGYRKGAPYHHVLIDGAVEYIPEAIIEQLDEGGRLGTALSDRGITRLVIGRKSGIAFGYLSVADAGVPALPGFICPKAFTF